MRRLVAGPARALIALVALTAVLAARGADACADGPDDPAKGAKFATLEAAVTQAFAEKHYDEAASLCREQIALAPEENGPYYNLACALARQGKKQDALDALK